MIERFQVIIPLTGNGSRFVAAGYKDLKPLIEIDGERMISWIVKKMFSSQDQFVFVCREQHLIEIPWMESYLLGLAPNAKILKVQDWNKLGPVFDIMKVKLELDDSLRTVVSYCDYFMKWNWEQFKRDVIVSEVAGAIPCYTGFHPHLIPSENVYGSCLTDDSGNLIEIREKFSFEKNKLLAKHSPGLYYFKTGSIMKKYFQKSIDTNLSLNGEFYCSLPYNLMVADKLAVSVPLNVDFFCQWGTPKDLEDFKFWMNVIRG